MEESLREMDAPVETAGPAGGAWGDVVASETMIAAESRIAQSASPSAAAAEFWKGCKRHPSGNATPTSPRHGA